MVSNIPSSSNSLIPSNKRVCRREEGNGKDRLENTYGCPCYSIYVKQRSEPNAEDPFALPTNGGFYAYQLAYELCKLEHLKEYGVRLERIGSV